MSYHKYVVGSTKKIPETLRKVFNNTNLPTLEYIALSDIESMDSQRETSLAWAYQKLKERGGLDMFAFGTLLVFEDPRGSGKYRCWDGNGRHTIANLVNKDMKVPCMVYKIPKQDAGFYFSYTQDKGRRRLSAEVLFQALHQSGDAQSLITEEQLIKSKLYVKQDASYPIGNTSNTAHEVKIRGFMTAIKLASITRPQDNLHKSATFVAQAVDMISEAFHIELKNRNMINNDILWALTIMLRVYPKLRDGKTNQNLRQFLNNGGAYFGSQKKFALSWKSPKNIGTTGNDNVAKSLAIDLITSWSANPNTLHYSKGIVLKDLKDLNI